MLGPTRDYFVKDGLVLESGKFDPSWIKRNKIVYEVMRIIDGVPLFYEEHLERFIQSTNLGGLKTMISRELIEVNIEKLLDANPADNGNILFCLVNLNEKFHFLTYFVPHYYPSKDEYESGVLVRSMNAMRKHPKAKIWNTALREKAQQLKEISAAYEILLIDKHMNITEGSKSNIFFIRGNSVITTPGNKVLLGITRKKIIELCGKMQLRFSETEIPLNEITIYESAFLSGTSPGILPIQMIDKVRFNCANENLRKLMHSYDALVNSIIP